MPVEGIGGVFFRASDPVAMAKWYLDHLDVGAGGGTSAEGASNPWVWSTRAGPVAFQPFDRDSDYFAPGQAFMLNLRVSDLDALLDRLRAADIQVLTNPEWDASGLGRFARIHDPDNNAVELWEPAD